jgi:hypothetical protein
VPLLRKSEKGGQKDDTKPKKISFLTTAISGWQTGETGQTRNQTAWLKFDPSMNAPFICSKRQL